MFCRYSCPRSSVLFCHFLKMRSKLLNLHLTHRSSLKANAEFKQAGVNRHSLCSEGELLKVSVFSVHATIAISHKRAAIQVCVSKLMTTRIQSKFHCHCVTVKGTSRRNFHCHGKICIPQQVTHFMLLLSMVRVHRYLRNFSKNKVQA